MVWIVIVGRQRTSDTPFRRAFCMYLERAASYVPTREVAFKNEEAFSEWWARQRQKQTSWLLLLDSQGQLLSSEELAAEWRRWKDMGRRQIAVAIGPASGWSREAREQADCVLSLGPMTFPHELAAVLAAEQVYRVLTILAGHPYHSGH